MADEKNFQEEFSEKYIPQANWFSFDNVGEYIKGTFVESFYKEGSGVFPSQWIYVLKNVEAKNDKLGLDGKAEDPEETFNVGIKEDKSFIHSRLKRVKPGQRIGFKFEKEIPPQTKGYNPAKSIVPYVWGFDPNFTPQEEESMDDVEDISFD